MDPVLAFDTSVTTARVALLDGEGRRLGGGEASSARHSSNLLRLCSAALGQAGLDPSQLGGVACGSGPGSFTGLRVGLAVAKGLCLATGVPLVLVPSLEALAHDLAVDAPVGALLVPCLDAGKAQLYAALFERSPGGDIRRASEDWALTVEDLCSRLPAGQPVVAGGSGADRYAAELDERLGRRGKRLSVSGPTAESVGRLALGRLGRGEADDLAASVPAYVRPPDITAPKKARRPPLD